MLRLLLFLSLSAMGCNEGEFTGGSGSKAPQNKEKKPVTAQEDEGQKASHRFAAHCIKGQENPKNFEFEVESSDDASIVTIEGSLCQELKTVEVTEPKKIVFALDTSGSMQEIDPLVGGTCSRLGAAQALVSSLKTRFPDPTLIYLSIVEFGDSAQSVTGGEYRLLDFELNFLSPQIFCKTLPQATNYEAAFDLISRTLDSSETHIYMITDGAPSIDLTGQYCLDENRLEISPVCRQRSAVAAATLRSQTPNLNILFLSDPINPQASEGYRAYLVNDIAGDPNRVKFASNASEAVAQIEDFEKPSSTSYESLQASGSLRDLDQQVDFDLTEKSDGRWEFQATFELPSNPGTYVLDIASSDGGVATDLGLTITLNVTE